MIFDRVVRCPHMRELFVESQIFLGKLTLGGFG